MKIDQPLPTLPLVSAIMLAGQSTIRDVLGCIEDFKSQTYKNKELIIVNNAKSQFAASELNIATQKSVFLVDTPTHFNAGTARNYGASIAKGEIIIQFDPDFWHARRRIEIQVANIFKQSAHASMLNSTYNYSFWSNTVRKSANAMNIAPNTLAYLKQPNLQYPDINKNEELGLLQNLRQMSGKIITVNMPELAIKKIGDYSQRLKSIGTVPKTILKSVDQYLKKYCQIL